MKQQHALFLKLSVGVEELFTWIITAIKPFACKTLNHLKTFFNGRYIDFSFESGRARGFNEIDAWRCIREVCYLFVSRPSTGIEIYSRLRQLGGQPAEIPLQFHHGKVKHSRRVSFKGIQGTPRMEFHVTKFHERLFPHTRDFSVIPRVYDSLCGVMTLKSQSRQESSRVEHDQEYP